MFVRIEVVHTVFIIALAFGAVPKLHPGTVLICSPAYRTGMASPADRTHLNLKIPSPLNLPGADSPVIPGHQEKNQEVCQRHANLHLRTHSAGKGEVAGGL